MTIIVPKGSYVYFHLKKGTNDIFYVGKGTGYRAWSDNKRNKYWQNVVNKYGFDVLIVSDGLSHDEAFAQEFYHIKKLLEDGVSITNLTEGGIGGPSKPVFCSNGMKFNSIAEAAIYACKEGENVSAARSNIGQCANGLLNSAKGHSWSYESAPNIPDSKINLNRQSYGVNVYRSDGALFSSLTEAVEVLKKENVKASVSGLFGALESGYMYAGFLWSRKSTPNSSDHVKSKSHRWRDMIGRKIIRSDGVCFFSVADAAEYTKGSEKMKGVAANINKAAAGKLNSACGYGWSFDCSKIPEFKDPLSIMSSLKLKTVRNSRGEVFKGLDIASKEMASRGLKGVSRSNISRSIRSKGNKTAGGMYWEYV